MPRFELVRGETLSCAAGTTFFFRMRPIINCKQTHELVSQSMDKDLSLLDRMRVRLHLGICTSCSNFNGQMHLLREAMRKFPMSELDDKPHDHSDERK